MRPLELGAARIPTTKSAAGYGQSPAETVPGIAHMSTPSPCDAGTDRGASVDELSRGRTPISPDQKTSTPTSQRRGLLPAVSKRSRPSSVSYLVQDITVVDGSFGKSCIYFNPPRSKLEGRRNILAE